MPFRPPFTPVRVWGLGLRVWYRDQYRGLSNENKDSGCLTSKATDDLHLLKVQLSVERSIQLSFEKLRNQKYHQYCKVKTYFKRGLRYSIIYHNEEILFRRTMEAWLESFPNFFTPILRPLRECSNRCIMELWLSGVQKLPELCGENKDQEHK